MTIDELRQYAKTFPSQGGVQLLPWLEGYASVVPQGGQIVEVGNWLGGSLAPLAIGAMNHGAEIHSYDRWRCRGDEEAHKAAKYGIILKDGEDTLPRVKEAMKPFPVKITYHQGPFKKNSPTAVWINEPIWLYVDDLTKTEEIWNHAMDIFEPYFIRNKTIMVLMDFHFDESFKHEAGKYKYAAQKRWIAANKNKVELTDQRMAGQSAAVFRYLGQL